MSFAAMIGTPTGAVELHADGGAITGLRWVAAGISARPGTGAEADATAGAEARLLAEAGRQLGQYFTGARQVFDLPLAPRGNSFQQRFYAVLCAIPHGRTRSYGEIAKEMGVSAQAIGQKNGG
ncbi:hypothetical protein U879_04255, partial [Defluviimonas sp. 20V17]